MNGGGAEVCFCGRLCCMMLAAWARYWCLCSLLVPLQLYPLVDITLAATPYQWQIAKPGQTASSWVYEQVEG